MFDLLPILNLKLINILNNKDLFEYTLTIIWKLIKDPYRIIQFTRR